ncbi:MAG: tetratricopeptide repeat protein [Betaproteobacteria bacterium]|nr:tetratricopeptide repeat protein [Betaproteobacteria bacterium]
MPTVTLLFTDIEGSTVLWEQDGARMSQALAAHDALARGAVEAHHGRVVKTTGDGIHAAFDHALDALAATVDLQQALNDPAATSGVPLRVRCGLHKGVVERRDDDYFGSSVNRAARIMSAAHGGQVLLSQAVVDDVADKLPAEVALRDLGKVRLKDLATPEQIWQVMHPLLRPEFPALRSLDATPNNLPHQATAFIGRANELAELGRLLVGARALTLTGAGGSGKTRLSLQAAADALESFPDGAWLAELAPLADPGLVAQTVATVLGLKEARGQSIAQTLCEHLNDKKLLLLLDNCEHLLDGCAQLVDTLVRRCPGVKILASSRQALGIAGEQIYRVPSLTLPDAKQTATQQSIRSFESVQLFIDRASLVRADFQVTDRNAPALASLCRQLDGIPLAIELAAARVRTLSIEEIDHKLDRRFRLLTGGSRTALPRHQTLRSLIDWSYDLLPEPEKLLLQRLSIFAGGWTLEAAEAVCADSGLEDEEILDRLTSLADKSLVVAEPADGRYRYRLLETVRQYAGAKLLERGSGDAVSERHRDYYLAVAEAAESRLRSGADQATQLRRLEEEHDNLRAALDWSLAGAASSASLRLCGSLTPFWGMRGHFAEGRDRCARVLAKARAGEQTQELAKVLQGAGRLAYMQADYAAARALHDECLAIMRQSGDRRGIAASLTYLGSVAVEQGDWSSARTLLEEGLAITRELGDRAGTAFGLANLALLAHAQGDFGSARALFEECLEIAQNQQLIASALNGLGIVACAQLDFHHARACHEKSLQIMRELGDRCGTAMNLLNLGDVASELGNTVDAEALYMEGLAIMRELGDRRGLAGALGNLGRLALDQDDLPRACSLFRESLTIQRELGDRRGIADSLAGLAAAVPRVGGSLDAARIFGAAEQLRIEIGSPLAPKDQPRHDRRVAAARSVLGDDAAFDRAWQEGRALTTEEAINLALGETVNC